MFLFQQQGGVDSGHIIGSSDGKEGIWGFFLIDLKCLNQSFCDIIPHVAIITLVLIHLLADCALSGSCMGPSILMMTMASIF